MAMQNQFGQPQVQPPIAQPLMADPAPLSPVQAIPGAGQPPNGGPKYLPRFQITEGPISTPGPIKRAIDVGFDQTIRDLRQKGIDDAPFDPEGSGYDYKTAIAAGIKPDKTGHWPSRDPKTGQILKGRGHKTFHKTLKGEEEAGYVIEKGDDGRYYSKLGNTIGSVVKSARFKAETKERKFEVMATLDPKFKALSPEVQQSVIEELHRRSVPDEMAATHEPLIKPKKFKDSLLKKTLRVAMPAIRPVTEGLAASAGGLSGVPLTPAGMVALGATGYTIAKDINDKLEVYAGSKAPETTKQALINRARDFGTGVTMEIGGQLFVGALMKTGEVGKKLGFKILEKGKAVFTKQGAKELAERKAGEVLMADLGNGNVMFAKNKKQADWLEKQIPGLKFSLSQKHGRPDLIRKERAAVIAAAEGGADAFQVHAAQNNEALEAYFNKHFASNKSIDDVINALNRAKKGLGRQAEAATEAAMGKARALPSQEPQQAGVAIREAIEDAKEPVKKTMSKLKKDIPDYPMEFTRTNDEIAKILKNKNISPTQKSKVEDFKKIYLDTLKKQGQTTHTANGIRKELTGRIEKLFANNEGEAAAGLKMVKKAMIRDIDEVGRLAKAGKISEYKGQTVDPNKISQQLEKDQIRLAKMGTGEEPDLFEIKSRLSEKGIPVMQQRSEGPKEYTERLVKDYERLISEDIPMVTSKANQQIKENLEASIAHAQKVLREAAPGQDVAASVRAYNHFAHTEWFKKFDSGAIAKVTARGKEAGYKYRAESVHPILNTETGADQLIDAVGKDTAKSIMKGQYAYDMMQKAAKSGQVSSKDLGSWLSKNELPLKKYGLWNDFKGISKAQGLADQAVINAKEFETAAVNNLLKADAGKAIANAIKGNSMGKAAADLMSKVKGNPAAEAGLRRAFSEHILKKVKTTAADFAGNPVTSNAKFQRMMDDFQPALEVLYTQPQRKALRNIADAHNKLILNTKSPIGGGSDTVEKATDLVPRRLAHFLAGKKVSLAVGAIQRMASIFTATGKKNVNELLLHARLDPKLAQTLIDAVDPNMGFKQFNRSKIFNLADYQPAKGGKYEFTPAVMKRAAAAAGIITGEGKAKEQANKMLPKKSTVRNFFNAAPERIGP